MSDIAAQERGAQLRKMERTVMEKVSMTNVAGKQDKRTDVYEIFGSTAQSNGWDFTVCQTIRESLDIIGADLDDLEDGEELRIVYRRYTPAQMEEVVFDE